MLRQIHFPVAIYRLKHLLFIYKFQTFCLLVSEKNPWNFSLSVFYSQGPELK